MEIKTKYNCSFPGHYTIRNLAQCGNQSDAHFIDYLLELKNEFYANCEKQCPKECDSAQYKIKWEKSGTLNIFFPPSDFHFHYAYLSSLEIIQILKMNEFNLLASIGGSLGLFIGVRFLSLVEVIEFFIDIFFCCFIHLN